MLEKAQVDETVRWKEASKTVLASLQGRTKDQSEALHAPAWKTGRSQILQDDSTTFQVHRGLT